MLICQDREKSTKHLCSPLRNVEGIASTTTQLLMKMFWLVVLLFPALATASDSRRCYVHGQCQGFSLDFSAQYGAEGCHAFCGKLDGCNWWSWDRALSLCLAFENCTLSGGPVSEDCIMGEKLCQARDCHQQHKCKGHFVDSFVISHIEDCIAVCNYHDNCNWYTLEKIHNYCMLYEDCNLHNESCTACATGSKSCSNAITEIHASIVMFQQENICQDRNEKGKCLEENRRYCGRTTHRWLRDDCNKLCNACGKPPACRLDEGYKYTGKTLGKKIKNVPNAENCRLRCDRKGASHFTYWARQRDCHCKKSGQGRKRHDSSTISGFAKGCGQA